MNHIQRQIEDRENMVVFSDIPPKPSVGSL